MTRTRRTFLTALVGGAAALLSVRRPAGARGTIANVSADAFVKWEPRRGDFRQVFHPEEWEAGDWYCMEDTELGYLKRSGWELDGHCHLSNNARIVEVDQVRKTVTFADRSMFV